MTPTIERKAVGPVAGKTTERKTGRTVAAERPVVTREQKTVEEMMVLTRAEERTGQKRAAEMMGRRRVEETTGQMTEVVMTGQRKGAETKIGYWAAACRAAAKARWMERMPYLPN